ncbi:MAG TPA: response regulator transcription factor [Burkholderiales bacterium]|jgi:two-component system chemotaxis response regulator CheY|nr:response regulator transcription factor [Burkholderiales bacterium]
MADNNTNSPNGRKTVYVVDDNEVVRRVLKGIIRQDGQLQYIGETTHGDAAVEALRKQRPDVLCLDVQMPGELDGIGVLRHVKQAFPGMKVVIITGYATSDLVKEARALGACGFVVKPFNAAKVLSTIHGALERDPQTA